jgi:C1A family cysteine protease
LEKQEEINVEFDNYTIFNECEFLDMSQSEFHKILNLNINPSDVIEASKSLDGTWAASYNETLAADVKSWDWRTKNAVSPVKNQGSCGSCYAFSALSTLESQYFLKYKKLKSLSEQQIIDCDVLNHGCNSGFNIK